MAGRRALTPDVAAAIEAACLCLGVQRAARAVGRRFDAALRPVGLSNWQFGLLTMLDRDEAPTIGMLADALAMDRTTVTANLKPLERRGLLAIGVGTEDRRVRRPVLTEAGRALLREAIPLWEEAQAACEERLRRSDLAAFRAAMAALAA